VARATRDPAPGRHERTFTQFIWYRAIRKKIWYRAIRKKIRAQCDMERMDDLMLAELGGLVGDLDELDQKMSTTVERCNLSFPGEIDDRRVSANLVMKVPSSGLENSQREKREK
jgi:hypothetical protein